MPVGKGNRRPRGPMYCRALAGESDYNICINSDMTVSCNCHDYDGRAHIGDLETSTLEDVFAGPIVAGFQEALYRGDFPISDCATCPELAPLHEDALDRGPAPGRVPRLGIMLENTARCNLHCPGCMQHSVLKVRRRDSLSLADLERVAPMLAQANIEQICYFNLGAPFLSQTILEETEILRRHMPEVRLLTSTSGMLMRREDAVRAALLMDHIYFSIDGVDQPTLERYQRGGDFARSYENMRRLVRTRESDGRVRGGMRMPYVEWKYVMFRWNDRPEHVRRALELALAAGVDRLTFVPGSAPLKDISLRYYSDRTIQNEGSPNDFGVSFDFAPVPDYLQ